MARDWDLFAVAALPPMFALSYGLLRFHPDGPRRGALIALTGLFCVIPWIAVNASEPAALQRFQSLLALDPGRPGTQYGYEILGTYLRGTGRFAAAVEAFRRTLDLRPGYERYERQLALALEAAGEPQRAKLMLSKILYNEPLKHDLRNELAGLAIRLGDLPLARYHLEKLKKTSSHGRTARIALAKLALREGDPGEAERELQEILREPAPAEAHYLMGMTMIGLGRFQEALKHLEKARDLSWKADELHYFLGIAYLNTGRTEEARSRLGEYLDRAPDGHFASGAREALAWSRR